MAAVERLAAPPADTRADSRHPVTIPRMVLCGRALCILLPVAIWFAPLGGIDLATRHILAVCAFMVVAWITQAIDYTLAGLIGCFLFWALGLTKFGLAFSGFADESTWFLFAALLIGAIATQSGVARRLAYFIMTHMGVTYSRILLALIVTDFLLTFVVPSGIARVVIMAAIALGLVEAFDVQRGSNIGRGMFLILTYTANIFDKMIIAGAGSITARGVIETFGGVEIPWSVWFLAFLPCSIVTVLVAWRLMLWYYPPEKGKLEGGHEFLREELRKLGPMSSAERRAALLIAVAVVLWLTDSLHHISAAAVALGVALFSLLPRVGIFGADELRRLNMMPVFFIATALSMANVLASTPALELIAHAMFGQVEPFMTSALGTTTILYWMAFAYHFLIGSEIPMLSTSLPLVMTFAKEHAMSPLLLGLIWTFAAGGKLFAYQSGVIIVGYSYGYFDARDLLRLGWWLTVVEFAVLLLLVQFYWPLIGIS